MKQVEFARLAGVVPSAVTQAKQRGRLPLDENGNILIRDGMTPKELWDLTASQEPRHIANKERLEDIKAGGDQLQGIERLGAALKLETYKLQKAKAERENLALDKEAGDLIDAQEIDVVITDIGVSLRGLLEGMPDRLAPSIARHGSDVEEIHAEIETAMNDVLVEMSEIFKRKWRVGQ